MDNHKRPSNWDECCSCCSILEDKIKELEKIIELLSREGEKR